MSGDTKVVGVFGFPVEHSLSPAMHNAAFAALQFSYIYAPFSVAPDLIGSAVRSLPTLGIVGVNLTIPHKENVLPFLDEITPDAERVGAVNTVHNVGGRLVGCNTDGYGFFQPLRERGFVAAGANVVVVGAGGSARSVVFMLLSEGANVSIVNRSLDRARRISADARELGLVEALDVSDVRAVSERIGRSSLLVHTTNVGMHPNVGDVPDLPFDALNPDTLVYDLIYNPVETNLLRIAHERGCPTLNGVGMLVHQGAAAFKIWTGMAPPTDVMERAVLAGLEPAGGVAASKG